MMRFEKENSLIVVGGRDDKKCIFFNEVFLLALDSLSWIRVEIVGEGLLSRSSFCLFTSNHKESSEIFIFGGINHNFKLCKAITVLNFDKEDYLKVVKSSYHN
mmetsp:Transcript_21182/g.20336  ORF Transcript_21182/g.20336 Transcript_21182/m.20336 type:complete len:103 (+) Transcript_21182:65-373(+)